MKNTNTHAHLTLLTIKGSSSKASSLWRINYFFFFMPQHFCTNPCGIRCVFSSGPAQRKISVGLRASVCVQTVALAARRQRRRRCGTTGWSVWTTWPPLSSSWSSLPRRCRRAGTFWPSSRTTSRPSSGRERWGACALVFLERLWRGAASHTDAQMQESFLFTTPTGHLSFHRIRTTEIYIHAARSREQVSDKQVERIKTRETELKYKNGKKTKEQHGNKLHFKMTFTFL